MRLSLLILRLNASPPPSLLKFEENSRSFSLTFAAGSPPYGAFSNTPLNAPSESPPRNNCRIWLDKVCTSEAEIGWREPAGRKDAMSKLVADSGSRASILMVRQLDVAIVE